MKIFAGALFTNKKKKKQDGIRKIPFFFKKSEQITTKQRIRKSQKESERIRKNQKESEQIRTHQTNQNKSEQIRANQNESE